MTDISVIVLVGAEEHQIERCLEHLMPLYSRHVFVVESKKGDLTHGVVMAMINRMSARGINLSLVWHDWLGAQALQFNRTLANLSIDVEWVLRLDACEYLASETIEKLKSHFPMSMSRGVDDVICALIFELRRRFRGGEIRHATTGNRQVRMLRKGMGRYVEMLMGERLSVDGRVVDFSGAFCDDSLLPMSEQRIKHRGYARREADQAIKLMSTGVCVFLFRVFSRRVASLMGMPDERGIFGKGCGVAG